MWDELYNVYFFALSNQHRCDQIIGVFAQCVDH